MAIRKIITYPDPRLFVQTRTVTEFGPLIQTLIHDMFETLYAVSHGVGLAATQIGEDWRVAVIDVSPLRNEPWVLVNPEIIERDVIKTFDEGCLSLPTVSAPVERANRIRFKAQDQRGVTYEADAEGLFAECVQHEIDHLNGKLYYHLLSKVKQQRLLKRYEKQ